MVKNKETKKDNQIEAVNDNLAIDSLYQKVKLVIDQARATVYKTANFETIKANWEIGRHIVEEEQNGKIRAAKGDALVKKISEKLMAEYGSGFDYSNVKRMKQFYITFPKGDALPDQLI